MKKREEEVKEFVSWERKREFWFRIEFGVKRRPPPSGTCQPFRIAQHPFYSTNSSRAIFTYAPLIHLHGERFTNVEHFSNESRDRVLEEDPRWIYIFDIVDRTLYLAFLLFIFFFTVGVHCCINIGISSNVSRYDSIKNHEGISVSCSTSVDTFHSFRCTDWQLSKINEISFNFFNIALETMRRIEKFSFSSFNSMFKILGEIIVQRRGSTKFSDLPEDPRTCFTL